MNTTVASTSFAGPLQPLVASPIFVKQAFRDSSHNSLNPLFKGGRHRRIRRKVNLSHYDPDQFVLSADEQSNQSVENHKPPKFELLKDRHGGAFKVFINKVDELLNLEGKLSKIFSFAV